MSDEALRRLERALALDPDRLELRRQHVQLLRRTGDEERALAAIDLAWRLGAEELWDELVAGLQARRLRVGGVELAWVPGGPFVMGSHDMDQDAAPPHLVELSSFYVALSPLTYGDLLEWEQAQPWWGTNEWMRRLALSTETHARATSAVAHLERTARPPGLAGSWAVISEAQWERVFRAAHLRPDGVSPYGVRRAERAAEWTRDGYDPEWYSSAPRLDPVSPAGGELFVVRGAPGLPEPHWALFREAARADGRFQVGGLVRTRWVQHEHGIAVRPVFEPAAPVTPDAVTPDAVTPDAVTPAAVGPAPAPGAPAGR